MEILDENKQPRSAQSMASDLEDLARDLAWAVHHPQRCVIKRVPSQSTYFVHLDGEPMMNGITEGVLRGLLMLRMINPSPDNPHEAVGNPDFLAQNPQWRKYLFLPSRRAR